MKVTPRTRPSSRIIQVLILTGALSADWARVAPAQTTTSQHVKQTAQTKMDRLEEELKEAQLRAAEAELELDGLANLHFERRNPEHEKRVKKASEDLRRTRKRVTEIRNALRSEAASQKPARYTEIDVFFATNRAPLAKPGTYGSDEASLRFGRSTVTIPPNHHKGSYETAPVWRVLFGQSVEYGITLKNVEETNYADFKTDLGTNLGKTRTSAAFVFVHGFNVSFEDAITRTGQLAFDLELGAVPIAFTWPARKDFDFSTLVALSNSMPFRGRGLFANYSAANRLVTNYTHDEQAAANARPVLVDFLKELSRNLGAKEIYLLGHSMGNRILTRALERLALTEPTYFKRRFSELILTAPDIGATEFEKDIAPVIPILSRHSTMYASSNDVALKLSKHIHGYARLGEVISGKPFVNPGFESIDVSAVDSNLIGHSYYGDNKSVISDMHHMVKFKMPPGQRFGIIPQEPAKPQFWTFKP